MPRYRKEKLCTPHPLAAWGALEPRLEETELGMTGPTAKQGQELWTEGK